MRDPSTTIACDGAVAISEPTNAKLIRIFFIVFRLRIWVEKAINDGHLILLMHSLPDASWMGQSKTATERQKWVKRRHTIDYPIHRRNIESSKMDTSHWPQEWSEKTQDRTPLRPLPALAALDSESKRRWRGVIRLRPMWSGHHGRGS